MHLKPLIFQVINDSITFFFLGHFSKMNKLDKNRVGKACSWSDY